MPNPDQITVGTSKLYFGKSQERAVTVQVPIWKDIGMHAAAKIKFGTGFTLRENRRGIIILFNSKTQT